LRLSNEVDLILILIKQVRQVLDRKEKDDHYTTNIQIIYFEAELREDPSSREGCCQRGFQCLRLREVQGQVGGHHLEDPNWEEFP